MPEFVTYLDVIGVVGKIGRQYPEIRSSDLTLAVMLEGNPTPDLAIIYTTPAGEKEFVRIGTADTLTPTQRDQSSDPCPRCGFPLDIHTETANCEPEDR